MRNAGANLGLTTAVDDLNRVRARAELTDYDGPTDKESLRQEVFDERSANFW